MKRSRSVVAGTVAGLIAVVAIIFALKALPPRPSDAAVTNGTTLREATFAGAIDTTPELDREALAAVERMGAYLRTLKSFQLHAEVLTEDVRVDGQKIQLTRVVDLVARRPDRLFAEVTSPNQRRQFFFDGKTFTLWAPRSRYYATVAAPSTIAGLADELEEKYGVELPLVDLFRWGTSSANTRSITSAISVAPSQIDGVTCAQYAFHQEGLDWQVWIQLGEHPLPRRIVITTLTDEARPQHMATYKWNLAPSFNDATFLFEPPADAKKIPFAQVKVEQPVSSGGRASKN